VTRLEYGTGFKRDIKLHRKNRARSIHSSLAIEGENGTGLAKLLEYAEVLKIRDIGRYSEI
jgi:hypothetical protein